MNANTILHNALTNEYGPSAGNFAITVCARQLAFRLESQGFKARTDKSDTNGAPNPLDGSSAFDAALSIDVPGIDFQAKPRPFDTDAACKGLAATMLLAVDARKIPLEYGRLPSENAFAGYFSTPSDWLARKVEYHKPRLIREAQESGFTFKASVEAIQKNADAKVAEYVAFATAIARDMAAAIKVHVSALKTRSREELAEVVCDSFTALGMDPREELKGAGNALLKAKRERYERGEKTATPQPGMLAMLKACGCDL